MKVLGIIPARYASSRFPGKPLINLNGKTMIQRVYEGVKKSNKFTKIVVATDDQRIFDEVIKFGGDVMMTSAYHTTGTDRCGEVLSKFNDFDVVVNIQGDEPLVDFRQLDSLVNVFEDEDVQIGTLGIKNISLEEIENQNRIKIVINKNNEALYFSRSVIPNFKNAKNNPLDEYPYMRHIGLYAYRAEVLNQLVNLEPTDLEKIESLEQLRWLFHGFKIKVIETTIETPNIDTPEDIENVLKQLQEN